MELLEREEALAGLESALRDVLRDGAGVVAFVSGEAGIGKTSLIRAFLASVPDDVRVLVGGCDDLAVPRALGPFHEIAELASQIDEEPEAAPSIVLEHLRRMAGVVCVIEDAHWADEATLDVLGYVARRIESVRALLVVSLRDDELDVAHPLRRVLALGGRRVVLEPLSECAVGVLAGPEVDARALHEVTGGNPFFVTESLGHGLSPTLRDAVLARLVRLGEAGRGVAELVSVVPGQAELSLVETAQDGLLECEAGGLLIVEAEYVRFRHELARRVVEDALSGARRRALNQAVLGALTARAADAARLAHHARGAGDVEAVVRYGLVAGRRAAAAGAHRQARELLSPLLEHIDLVDEHERAPALELLSQQAYNDARPDVAIPAVWAALAARRASGDPLGTSVSLRWLSRLCWWRGDPAGAEAAAEEAIAVLDGLPPGRELAMALSNRSQLAMLAQQDERAAEWARRAIELAERLDDVETLVHATTNLGSALTRRQPERGRALLEEATERALAAGLDEHACRAMANAGWAARDAGDLVYARATARRGVAYAAAHEVSTFTQYIGALDALVDLSSGDWDAAVANAAALPEDGNKMTRVPVLEVLGLVALRRGEPAAALLDRAWELAVEADELQRLRPIACARAEAAWLASDLAGVDAATASTYELALRLGHGWDIGALAVWRARAGCLAEPPAELAAPFALELAGDHRAAGELWTELGFPYEAALSLLGDEALRLDALARLDELGAVATASVVRRRLRAAGAQHIPRGPRAATRRHPAGLTPRQAEILELLAEGLTNAQIAERLVVSKKTVDHHVSAILERLGVASRREAVARASTA